MSYFDIAFYFLLYSFLGWVVEVVFHVYKERHLINRGFLAGPVCPVYGFGMLGILSLLQYFTTHQPTNQIGILPTFLLGFVVCSLVEFIAGWILDVIFHARWWDYRNEKWNIHGYVCLKFSLLWGLGVVILIYGIHPFFTKIPFQPTHQTIYWVVLAICYAIYAFDFLLTVSVLIGLNKKLREIDQLQDQLSLLSDSLTIALGDASLTAIATAEKASEKSEEIKESYENAKEKGMEHLNSKQQEIKHRIADYKEKLYSEKQYTLQRLFCAFPTVTSKEHFAMYEEIKAHFNPAKKK